MKPVVQCINLEKKYFLFEKDYKIIPWLFTKKGCSEEITTLTDINLTINEGDVIAFIGKNGAGKSTLMKIIAGITMNTDGELKVNGKVNSLINLGAGFNAKYTGRENIYYKGTLMGMSKDYLDSIIDEIIDFCDIGHYFDLPTYMYSSGMKARLGFALAIYSKHDILIVDEVFAVGDKAFREKSANKMKEILTSGKSIIFASHSDDQIKQFCNRAIFIDDHRIVLDGTVDEVLHAYNKKYAPEKVRKKPGDFETEQEKALEFLKMVRNTPKVEKYHVFREIGVMHEYNGEFDKAYYYMDIAREFRPNDDFVIKRLSEYEKQIDVENIENQKREKSKNNINNLIKRINNRNEAYGNVELFAELGYFYEYENDFVNAFKYIGFAHELRPSGEFLLKKYLEYEIKVNEQLEKDI